MKLKFVLAFVLSSGSVIAGELSPALRAAFASFNKEDSFIARLRKVHEMQLDLAKATTEGIKVPVGSSYELTLAIVESTGMNSRGAQSILIRMNSADAEARGLIYKIVDESLSDWQTARSYRRPDTTFYEAQDGATVARIDAWGEASTLSRFILAAAQSEGKVLPGAHGL